jgi:hypothetical protein
VVAQLADQAALGVPERLAEDAVPGLPHELEQRRRVPRRDRLLREQAVVAHETPRLGVGAVRVRASELAFDEGAEPGLEQLQRLADAFVVGGGHFFNLPRSRSDWRKKASSSGGEPCSTARFSSTRATSRGEIE